MARITSYSTPKSSDTTYVSSGNFKMDIALGGGFPEYNLVGLAGADSCGKTTIAANTIASALKKYPNSKALYISTEANFVAKSRLESLGVDITRVDTFFEPNAGDIDKKLKQVSSEYNLDKNNYVVIVIDSLNGISNDADVAADGVGYQKRPQFISKLIKLLTEHISERRAIAVDGVPPVTVLCPLQVSQNLDMFSYDKYTIAGGQALLHGLNLILMLSAREVSASTGGVVKLSATAEYPLGYLVEHPEAKTLSKKQNLLSYVTVKFKKEKGVYRKSFDYMLTNFTLEIRDGLQEQLKCVAGREYRPTTYHELATLEDIFDGRARIPYIGVTYPTSKESIMQALGIGINFETGEIIDFDRLEKYLTLLMRYEMHKQGGVPVIPADGYLCGIQASTEDWDVIYNDVVVFKEQTHAVDLQDYLSKFMNPSSKKNQAKEKAVGDTDNGKE